MSFLRVMVLPSRALFFRIGYDLKPWIYVRSICVCIAMSVDESQFLNQIKDIRISNSVRTGMNIALEDLPSCVVVIVLSQYELVGRHLGSIFSSQFDGEN
jgi:hypothetical protein